jgi:hypothetical protein
MTERLRCGYPIEGPRDNSTGKVWWRRTCKRWAVLGLDRCWQHASAVELGKVRTP